MILLHLRTPGAPWAFALAPLVPEAQSMFAQCLHANKDILSSKSEQVLNKIEPAHFISGAGPRIDASALAYLSAFF